MFDELLNTLQSPSPMIHELSTGMYSVLCEEVCIEYMPNMDEVIIIQI